MTIAKDEIKITIGHVLKEKREKAGLSQDDLARMTALDRSYISQIERGIKNPTLIIIFQICEYIQITPEEFIAEVQRNIRKKE